MWLFNWGLIHPEGPQLEDPISAPRGLTLYEALPSFLTQTHYILWGKRKSKVPLSPRSDCHKYYSLHILLVKASHKAILGK